MRLASFFVLAAVAFAADATGTWKAEFETPDGTKRTNTFAFKQEGEKLSGTVKGSQDETRIENGSVKGDDITFEAERPFGHFKYKGKVTATEIKLTINFNDASYDIVARKVP